MFWGVIYKCFARDSVQFVRHTTFESLIMIHGSSAEISSKQPDFGGFAARGADGQHRAAQSQFRRRADWHECCEMDSHRRVNRILTAAGER